MAAHFCPCLRSNLRTSVFPPARSRVRSRHSLLIRASSPSSSSSNGDSYLDMWRKAVDRERRSQEFRRITERRGDEGREDSPSLEAKTERFNELLRVPKEERDRVQRLQVIDRASAAIAAARALIESPPSSKKPLAVAVRSLSEDLGVLPEVKGAAKVASSQQGSQHFYQSDSYGGGSPGPDFWSWSPPSDIGERTSENGSNLLAAPKSNSSLNAYPSMQLMEKERSIDFLAIPLESSLFEDNHGPPLPPLQSVVEEDKVKTKSTSDFLTAAEQNKLDEQFLRHAVEAAEVLDKIEEASAHGVNPDGSKWWRETGIEQRPDGVVCKWTLTRGVSSDESVEWEDKFWEAADKFDYKELGSEKSGRDAYGNVWREHWRESMWQDLKSGLLHMEKTADKWGKSTNGNEWQEQWFEHYDASGQAEKWAHKWCSIDPSTPLEAGHAHVWHERWGEKYDGKGGSMKYTDKWAERSEGDGWSKWGDKWDENFNSYGHGVKQGETWWEGKHGDRWNRTWGEQHNGTGWVHKYGKSSSGEHWDTHAQQETWYERHPHFGFQHCFQNSVQLRAVRRPLNAL